MRGCYGFDFDADFDWSRVIVVTAEDIPGDNVVSLISDDQPILIPVGGTIRHQAEPLALLAAADRETLREARRRDPPADRAAGARLRPAGLEPGVRPVRDA